MPDVPPSLGSVVGSGAPPAPPVAGVDVEVDVAVSFGVGTFVIELDVVGSDVEETPVLASGGAVVVLAAGPALLDIPPLAAAFEPVAGALLVAAVVTTLTDVLGGTLTDESDAAGSLLD